MTEVRLTGVAHALVTRPLTAFSAAPVRTVPYRVPSRLSLRAQSDASVFWARQAAGGGRRTASYLPPPGWHCG